MLKSLGRTLLAAAIAGLVLAQTASATVYVNKRFCGGTGLSTCAAVILDVTGTTVTLRVWNLANNTAASYGTTSAPGVVFQGVGLYNVPAAVDLAGGLTTTGPARSGNTPGNWVVRQNRHIGFLIDFGAVSSVPSGFNNGIASGCASPADLPPTSINLYLNPCTDPSGAPLSSWVTFTFQVNQTWNASNVGISIRGQDWNSGVVTECATAPHPTAPNAPTCFQVVPEPLTMTLLATGLVALGGVGFIRRRRAQQQS